MNIERISRLLSPPSYSTRWCFIGHTYFGLYVIDGSDLSVETLISDLDFYQSEVRAAKKEKILRILSDDAAVLVYVASGFSEDVVNYLRVTRLRKWRHSAHVVLYDNKHDKSVYREDVQNENLLIFEHLDLLFYEGIVTAKKCAPM